MDEKRKINQSLICKNLILKDPPFFFSSTITNDIDNGILQFNV